MGTKTSSVPSFSPSQRRLLPARGCLRNKALSFAARKGRPRLPVECQEEEGKELVVGRGAVESNCPVWFLFPHRQS